MTSRKISTFVGTAAERQARAQQRAAAQRQASLSRMSPDQRAQVLGREAAAKEQAQNQEKAQKDAKIRSTVAKGGSREERAEFRAEKARVNREDALARMTPEQREQALAQEASAKEKKDDQEKAQKDAKIRNTVAKGGSREERAEFRAEKARVNRQDALARMTPEQRKRALDQEAAAKAAADEKARRERNEKARRTVSVVGDKEERQSFRAEKAAVNRQDALAQMTPVQRQQALAQEAAARQAAAAEKLREQAEKERRTVAVVGDKSRRDAFGAPRVPRGTSTVVLPAGLAISRQMLGADIEALENSVALLS